MKKIVSVLLVIIMLTVSGVGVISTEAVTFVSDDEYDYAVVSDDEYALYRYHGNETNLVLPSTFVNKKIVGIYSDCFYERDIESVEIPDGYEYIGALAFYGCTNLSEIVAPKSIVSIGNMAFAHCTSLTNVDLSDANELEEIPYAMCMGNSVLSNVNLPDSITAIGETAFSETKISTLIIPPKTEFIGDEAFKNCTELKEANLPDSLTEIGYYIFANCSSLSNVRLGKRVNVIRAGAFKNCFLLQKIDLSNKLSSIGEEAFMNDSSISKVFIPDSVTVIGENAFESMIDNESIEIKCFSGSYAEEHFAGYNNLVVIDKKLGDYNLDGSVNVSDATIIQKYCAKIIEKQTYQAEENGDVNKDGSVTVRDATLIQMRVAGIITSF